MKIFFLLSIVMTPLTFADFKSDLKTVSNMVTSYGKLDVLLDSELVEPKQNFLKALKNLIKKSQTKEDKKQINELLVKAAGSQAYSREYVNEYFPLISQEEHLEMYQAFDLTTLRKVVSQVCRTKDCIALITNDAKECFSRDCVGLISENANQCYSRDCASFVRGDANECYSYTCQAFASNNEGFCKDRGDCIGILTGNSDKCYSSYCTAFLKEPRECKTYECSAYAFYLNKLKELNLNQEEKKIRKKIWIYLTEQKRANEAANSWPNDVFSNPAKYGL